MGLIDLHVHSNASDGTLSPAQISEYALKKGLSAIALTDHDTVHGVAEATTAASGTSLEIVPGTELSCTLENMEIHILGLFIDYKSVKLRKSLSRARELRDNRNIIIIKRFQQDGIQITMEDLVRDNTDTVVTRAHFARILVEKGYVTTVDQAFKRYLQYGGRYCPAREKLSPKEAISMILEADGFPAVAHPLQYKLGWAKTAELISFLKDLGIKGVEVYYSSHNQYESSRLKEIAKLYSLLPTGGSDFHGANKPDIDMGSGRGGLRVSDLLLDDIKKSGFPQK